MYEGAERLAVEVLDSSITGKWLIVAGQALLALLMIWLAVHFSGVNKWKSPPPRADRWDWMTYSMLRSRWASVLPALVLTLALILCFGWLFVEVVAWTSPEVSAAVQEAKERDQSFEDAVVDSKRLVIGRITSFSMVFAAGACIWNFRLLWKARVRVKQLPPPL